VFQDGRTCSLFAYGFSFNTPENDAFEGFAMRSPFACRAIAAALLVTAIPCAFAEHGGESAATSSGDWNRFTAAQYLDARQTWWMNWPKARRDHETACVSCHTAVPYALSRPSLRDALNESGVSAPEREMLGYIARRVTLWDELEPFYSDQKVGPRKTVESRGTESVLNALILARYDSRQGRLTELSQKAFEHMWATQLVAGADAGSWEWLNFHNAPWESNESHYWGSALAAVAVGIAPGQYSKSASIQPKLAALKAYLERNYDAQPMANRLVVLWASGRVPGLLSASRRAALLSDVRRLQRSDGGWSLTDYGEWKRHDNTPLDSRSDGYATGLTVFALKEAGIPTNRPEMKRAVDWLVANQNTEQGSWPAYSLNKQRDLSTDVGRFMSDAATSYAVMALEAVRR
jgi:hypothetical protein